jgi:copper chaperone CopZ
MTTITYEIPNINCKHCVHTIKSELSEVPGVLTVEGDPATRQVTVTYEPPATAESLETLLAEINYPVKK